MDISDENLICNRDWDPSYLSQIFDVEFYDFTDMWASSNVSDSDLITEIEKVEHYCPIVEDISLDDSELCSAVEKIEEE